MTLMPATDSLARMMARPIAHRGLHACGAPGPVENTIPAALAAVEHGYGIECDVRFAGDGTPIVIHDATFERLAGRDDAIADLDAAAIAAIELRGGGTAPTVAALMEAIQGRVALVIEIKSPAKPTDLDVLLDLVAAYAGPVVLESFDAAILGHCAPAPCPVGLVGPGETPVPLSSPPWCDFLSWDVRKLDGLTPTLPLTSWTVRSQGQAALARSTGAQIVFEGWRP